MRGSADVLAASIFLSVVAAFIVVVVIGHRQHHCQYLRPVPGHPGWLKCSDAP